MGSHLSKQQKRPDTIWEYDPVSSESITGEITGLHLSSKRCDEKETFITRLFIEPEEGRRTTVWFRETPVQYSNVHVFVLNDELHVILISSSTSSSTKTNQDNTSIHLVWIKEEFTLNKRKELVMLKKMKNEHVEKQNNHVDLSKEISNRNITCFREGQNPVKTNFVPTISSDQIDPEISLTRVQNSPNDGDESEAQAVFAAILAAAGNVAAVVAAAAEAQAASEAQAAAEAQAADIKHEQPFFAEQHQMTKELLSEEIQSARFALRSKKDETTKENLRLHLRSLLETIRPFYGSTN